MNLILLHLYVWGILELFSKFKLAIKLAGVKISIHVALVSSLKFNLEKL